VVTRQSRLLQLILIQLLLLIQLLSILAALVILAALIQQRLSNFITNKEKKLTVENSTVFFVLYGSCPISSK
jgi:hypothetical protein